MRRLIFLSCLSLVACDRPGAGPAPEPLPPETPLPAPVVEPAAPAPSAPAPRAPTPDSEIDAALQQDLRSILVRAQKRTVEDFEQTHSAVTRTREIAAHVRAAQAAVKDDPDKAETLARALEAAADDRGKLQLAFETLEATGFEPPSDLEVSELGGLRRSGARIDGTVIYQKGETRVPAQVTFVLEEDVWKILELRRGAPLPVGAPVAAPAANSGAGAAKTSAPEPVPTASFEEVLEETKDLIRRQKYDEAEKAWTKFVLGAPSHKKANFELGRVLYLRGDLPGAKKQAEIACMQGWEDGCVQADLIQKELAARK